MRICIWYEGDELDVTHRHAIICGAGRGCLNLMNEMGLPGVAHVVDSNPGKVGKTIRLCGRNYRIQPFEYLASLDFNEYYLVVWGCGQKLGHRHLAKVRTSHPRFLRQSALFR